MDHTVRDPEGKPYAREVMIRDRKKMIQEWADYLDGLRLGTIVYDDPLANFTPVTSTSQKPSLDTNVIDFAKYHEVDNPLSRARSANQNTWSDWDDLDPRGWENVNEFARNSA